MSILVDHYFISLKGNIWKFERYIGLLTSYIISINYENYMDQILIFHNSPLLYSPLFQKLLSFPYRHFALSPINSFGKNKTSSFQACKFHNDIMYYFKSNDQVNPVIITIYFHLIGELFFITFLSPYDFCYPT